MARKSIEKKILSQKERVFLHLYVVYDNNALKAALEAGFPEASASYRASMLLKKPVARRYLEKIYNAGLKSVKKRAEDAIAEVTRIAHSDIRDFVSWTEGGLKLKPSEELGIEARVIDSIEIEYGRYGKKQKIKMHNKIDALTLIMKNLGLIQPDNSTTNIFAMQDAACDEAYEKRMEKLRAAKQQ